MMLPRRDPEAEDGRRCLLGAERLMLAMIGTVVDDLRRGTAERKAEAWSYLMREGGPEPLSFTSICSHFGWSTTSVRRELAKEEARRHARRWRSY
ncbi:MAG: hypothetical protein ACREQY_05830 [Candidatus Binatia bacterium]